WSVTGVQTCALPILALVGALNMISVTFFAFGAITHAELNSKIDTQSDKERKKSYGNHVEGADKRQPDGQCHRETSDDADHNGKRSEERRVGKEGRTG